MIKGNLKLVKSNLTDNEVKKTCKLACSDDFINVLPEKYDKVVDEGGVTLSGGQRQKFAIAMTFVQNTKIILFDELISAFDFKT